MRAPLGFRRFRALWVAVAQSYAGEANAAPSASNVTFTGTLSVGSTLTGDYDYSDPNGNPESGTTYQWYRADDASGTNSAVISGATALTYVVQAADMNKYLRLGVIPSDGALSGSEAFSARQGPVVVPAIELISTSSANTAGLSVTSLNIAKPTGVQEGDLLLLCIASVTASATTGGAAEFPAGWEGVWSGRTSDQLFSSEQMGYAYRIAGGSEPDTYTLSLVTTETVEAHICVWRNARIGFGTIHSTATTSATAKTLSVPTDGCVLIVGCAEAAAATTFATPTGMTSLIHSNSVAPSNAIFTQQVDAGITGTRVSSLSVAGTAGSVLLIPESYTLPVPEFVSQSSSRSEVSSGLTLLTVTSPADIQEGDLLVAAINCNSSETYTPNVAWTERAGSAHFKLLTRIATSSEPASYTFTTGTTTGYLTGVIMAYRNAEVGQVSAMAGPDTQPVTVASFANLDIVRYLAIGVSQVSAQLNVSASPDYEIRYRAGGASAVPANLLIAERVLGGTAVPSSSIDSNLTSKFMYALTIKRAA